MKTETEPPQKAASAIDSTDLVARLRKGPIREIVKVKYGGMKSIYDVGANMRLMREAAEKIEDLEYLLKGICDR